LLRHYLRDGKILTLLLVILPPLFAYGTAASNGALLSTDALLTDYINANQGNPLLGHIAANTIEAASIWRIRVSTAIFLAVISIVLTIANTRKDEEQGRLELLRSGAVGAKAPLTALFIKVYAANLLGGLLMAAGFIAAGYPAAGSFTAGFATALSACCFAGIAGVCAQIAPSARAARGLSFGIAAFFMFLLIIANMTSGSILIFTPFGWCAFANAYAGERLWLFPFAVFVVALLTDIAFILNERRDMYGGYIKERNGRASARPSFKTPFALAWRLQRGALIVWAAAYALMGLVLASLRPNIEAMLGGTGFLPALSAAVGGPGHAFLAIISYILTQVLSAYALMAILRARDEESLTRAELILSGAVSRVRYALGHLIIALAGSAVVLILFAAFSGSFASVIVRLPAVWVVPAVAACIYGFAPRAAAPASWGLFFALLIVEFLWEIRLVGNSIFKISPFAWVYPGSAVSAAAVVITLAVAAALIGVGLYGFSRRDITAE